MIPEGHHSLILQLLRKRHQQKPRVFYLKEKAQTITGVLKPRHVIFFRRILWSNVSNAFLRSIKIMPVRIPLSMPIKMKSVSCTRHKLVEKCAIKPNWYL